MTLRIRTQGSHTTLTETYTTTTFSGTVVVAQKNVGDLLRSGGVQTTTDVVTPKFASRVARGQIINHPFQSVLDEYSYSWSGHKVQTNSGSGSTIRYREWSHLYDDNVSRYESPYGNLPELPLALREACTEALAKVDETDVDGIVEGLEGKQTMQLFDRQTYNLNQQLDKEIRYAEKRGKYHFARVPVAVMANNWLLYRYGISPALALINETLVKGTSVRTRRRTSRGSNSTSASWDKTYPGSGSIHPNSVWTVRASAEASARAGVLYEYRNFTNKYGFSLEKLPRAFWEATTLSFVLDWFANTGEFISALTPRYSTHTLASWHGYEAKISQTQTVSLGNVASGYSVLRSCEGGYSNSLVTVRKRTPGLLSPVWRIREGAMRQVISDRRLIDAFALTSQKFLKLMRMHKP